MHPFFEPLNSREAMLLLTTLTRGSGEASIFAHLPDDVRARVQAKTDALLAIPTEKRVPFMVHEMKQAQSFWGLRGVERIDPSWIIQGLKGESARVVACVLISMPAPAVKSILKRLPDGIKKKLPPKPEVQRVPMVLVRAVRQIFESRFHQMPAPSAEGFAFKDIIQLERVELFRLMRDLGLTELGQAFVSVGKMALAELCRRLPRDKAEELILAVRGASQVDVPELKSAQRFLSRVVVNFNDTEEFFNKAGLWRLARASLGEDEAFRAAFRQRVPREAGQVYEQYLEKAAELADLEPDAIKRLQDTILLRVRELSSRRILNPAWAEMTIRFHDPAHAKPADEAAPDPEGSRIGAAPPARPKGPAE